MNERLLLQEATPAADALIWRIHREAFLQEGTQAWLDYRIPYSVTGNIALARQHVRVIRQSVPPGPEPVHVLELGAGAGFFAWHFLHAWQEQNATEGLERPLRYLLTDFSAPTLATVAAHPAFAEYVTRSELGIFVLDQLQPEALVPVAAAFSPPTQLQAVIGNYYVCTLPTTLLRCGEGGLEEKWCKTWLALPEGFPELSEPEQEALRDWLLHLPVSQVLSPEARTRFMQLGANWPAHVQKAALNWAAELPAELLTWIEETCFYEDWQPPEWASDSIPLIRAAATALEGQTFPCPHGLWERLRPLENWLAPGALLFLSDKGFYVSSEVLPADLAQPSEHGNTLAYPLHLDLICAWLRQRGWETAHTPYPFDPLQTVSAIWQPTLAERWREAFAEAFILHNANLDAARLIRAAQDYQEQGEDQLAVGFYRKALQYRPGEPRIIHELVAALIRLGAFRQAAEYLALPLCDLYAQFDFDYQRGQIAFFQGQPEQARTYFLTSLQAQGEYASVYYSLALCSLALNERESAGEFVQRCLALESEHSAALALQQKLMLEV